jgi:UDP-N-acetyl-D-glucosamine/UDP-N-acetyl-D-galactosamine dehydrogenase
MPSKVAGKGRILQHGRKIAVIGLGYVGLPIAVAFARSGTTVVGFDINQRRIEELRSGHDRTREVEVADLALATLSYTSDLAPLTACDFFIITVPTPIDDANRPDLGALLASSQTVGKILKRDDIVVYESTVYPGAIEEDCAPVLEKASGLKAGSDFMLGYSPERINPGDKAHRFETIVKVVSAQDEKTRDIVANVYGSVVKAGIHCAPSIRVAEAAKVIENTQRDLNIAFMNELSAIFGRMGIDTGDVLEAARTKWNFQSFQPGLVGGHCIGVDPYYLTHRAEKAGYRPEIILAGRRINDDMGSRVAHECMRLMKECDRKSPIVSILGITFKENVPDTRNSKVIDIVHTLAKAGIAIQLHDPLASAEGAREEYGIELKPLDTLRPADAVIFAVAHKEYVDGGWPLIMRLLKDGTGIVMDVKWKLDRSDKPEAIKLWRL